ncbi:Dynein regulatory complex subunit 4 [Perkinsus chesapeaki]|uniref:Dynein regulatory complex subunit 4 n=1 Tax=Perkinsus chesapeaki TaxID=330153 RepID=A0A7J6KX37_PERCH|nr:Dynein regulatory complex subunit 4 [Perkinsus chesapeaki]
MDYISQDWDRFVNSGQDAEAAEKLLALQKEAKRIREDYECTVLKGAKKTRNEREAELRNKERDLEDLNERQQIELKMFQQRLKHLRFHLVDQTIEQRIAIERDTQKKAEEQQLPREQEAFKAVRQTHVESKEKQTTAEAALFPKF